MVILTVLENITQKNKITAQKIMVIETKLVFVTPKHQERKDFKTFAN